MVHSLVTFLGARCYLCVKLRSRTNTVRYGVRYRYPSVSHIQPRMDDGTWLRKPLRGEIFVVDDDPAVRDTLSMVLTAGGYQVICFADGAALLAIARTRTPACILLDVHIPGKSGLDILKELHGEDYPAPIFMISGQGDIAMAVSAIKNGALDFIEKPFRGSEIVARPR